MKRIMELVAFIFEHSTYKEQISNYESAKDNIIFEPVHEISNNVVCAISKASEPLLVA